MNANPADPSPPAVRRKRPRLMRLLTALAALLIVAALAAQPTRAEPENAPQPLAATPVFRFPVVPGAVISGYFDHNPAAGRVTFFNGRQNVSSSYGFYFSCTTPNMYDFVGCEDPVAGEAACADSRELWYDGHKGIDYEFSPAWHTGAACNPNLFTGITRGIYAPAAGKVQFAGYDAGRPANGWHIRIKHDLNGNGNYEDDNFRSNFLHFTANALAVKANELVSEGQYLGLGGSTGYSSSPHLHFEVQRSNDNFSTSLWSVDPYGWSGPGSDPWPYQNSVLWRINLPHKVLLPAVMNRLAGGCPACGELLGNNGFEGGGKDWIDIGVGVITNRSDPYLPISPYAGDWLAWLGGRQNAVDTLYQTFTVPPGLGSARLRYYLYISSAETNGVYDRMDVRLRAADGSLIRQLETLDNAFTPANRWVAREVDLTVLRAYPGQALRISFEAVTDASLTTNFYLDEVSLSAGE